MKNPKLEDQLTIYCNTHPKRIKDKTLGDNFLKQSIYHYSQVLYQSHNCDPYMITITFPAKKPPRNIPQEWKQAVDFLQQFMQHTQSKHIIVGGILAVEPHKNTTLKNPKGKNTKAGAPHFHMVVWFCHDFLNAYPDHISFDLLLKGCFSKVSKLKTRVDILKAAYIY